MAIHKSVYMANTSLHIPKKSASCPGSICIPNMLAFGAAKPYAGKQHQGVDGTRQARPWQFFPSRASSCQAMQSSCRLVSRKADPEYPWQDCDRIPPASQTHRMSMKNEFSHAALPKAPR